MIPIPSGVRAWIATGHTDMRRGMRSLALTIHESLKRDSHAGDLYIFRGQSGDLVKILWHDGMWLYAKRLDRGKFLGAVSISAAQMAYMMDWSESAGLSIGLEGSECTTCAREFKRNLRKPM
ncbi:MULTISPECIES: IS66 family insertion sequence element accessory protein TnpB [Bradyrhizobium]|uniref:IS66 family insertion sequence element accessory protein TnpB n=1 Tax=Bradyrhizobium elkanii TaxID=29448 RepID=A0A4U6S0B1_BRAEL|nr:MULTISPECIES: IS66 family insertion sequence element accessory protein TnpB [Bradyrhizobium]MTV14082.1 IS66 family insertion sequence element accessory protein TnpB [Bradyrhizobium sp. BR2003]TKV80391.1 IS66 family insertion sequence element accessory protein TnpB [Bradyrhizobium elkanii]